MDARTESRILRLAIARGLLQWDDLDAVAERLPERDAGSVPAARWLDALVAAGRLDPQAVAELAAELERKHEDDTPNLTPWTASRSRSRASRPLELEETRAIESPAARAERIDPSSLPAELRFLATWDRYRVERFLGAGGMGSVYKAFDPALDRYVALKFLQWNEPSQAERFLHEARAQARVDHPNVCRVYEVGEVEGRPYISMQYIAGRSLSEMRSELSAEAKVRLVRDVARAVHAAHKTGLIHRDLKPGNILVGTGDSGGLHPYVVDFGLARDQDETGLTRTGMLSGTPAYLSPEQAQGQPLDRRTDVYSLGVVLYELLGGQPPFLAPNPAGILIRLLQEDAPPLRKLRPGIPSDLETLVMKCLEKDPGRRYDSARALAEDLDRYLEGEPVQARPASWAYRAGKKARKNKALAGVIAAACLALLVVGSLSLRAQWQARERAELAQRFGQRVKELEVKMRLEASLPLHNTAARRREIRRELAAIRSEMARLGPIAHGPGHYALGLGYFALHQYETARAHLEKAWSAGQRTSEVAAALGRALGHRYEKALAEASRSQSLEGKAKREEIQHTYRRPALSYLKEAVRAGEQPPPYLAALIAYYEGRYAQALAKAREAYRRDPWFYEAAQLEAEIYAAQADEAASAGLYVEAFRLFDQAGEVYRHLLSRVPSDAALYAAECGRRLRRIEVGLAVSNLPEDQVARALLVCDRALRVDPDLGEAIARKSRLYYRRGEDKARRGADPRPHFQTAVRLAERAIALDPADDLGYSYLAVTLRTLATWEFERGLDPWASLRQAIVVATKAVGLRPELASGHNDLGNAYNELARFQMSRGIDPRQALEQAAASYQQAIARKPEYPPPHTNLGGAWKMRAEYEIAQGMDPTTSLNKAAASLERAVGLNPYSPPTQNSLGNVHLTLADYQLSRGSDPRAALERAAHRYLQAVAIKPDYFLAYFNLGYAQRNLALALLERGENPGPAIRSAHSYLDRAAELNPADADVFVEHGRCEIIAARWASRQGQDPSPHFRDAASSLGKAEALNPSSPDVFLTQAQLDRFRAERELARGGRPGEAVRDGLARIEKALAINREEARYLAEKGVLLHFAALGETDPARRAERESQAAAALGEALKINPLLRREYGGVLAAIRRGTARTA